MALPLPAVQDRLLNHRAVDWLYRRFSPELQPYPTLKEALVEHFPSFVYAYIARRLTGSLQDPQRITLRLTEYVHDNVFWPSEGYAVKDTAPIDVLVRGIGVCDQQAHLLIRLVGYRNIPAYMVFLYSPISDATPHSVAKVYFAERWRYVDPLYRLQAKDREGRFATRLQIASGEASFSPISPESIGLESYRQLYEKRPMHFLRNLAADPQFFESVLRHEPLPAGNREQTWKPLLSLPDRIGSGLFLDLYLRILQEEQHADKAEWIYYAARIRHILLKFPEARRGYARLLREYPDSPHKEEALFFMGLAAYHEGNHAEALKIHQEFIRRYPDSIWMGYAQLYLAKSFQLAGNYRRARNLFKALAIQSRGEPSRMARWALSLMKDLPAT